MLGHIGFALFVLGCAGIESEDMIIPAVMVLGGLALIFINYIKEKSFSPNRPK